MASEVEDDTFGTNNAMAEALGNSVILHQIFRNLENKLLLSSCRLVSQFWSREATSFIQNYRQCNVVQPDGTTPCKFLEQFDNWLGQLAESHRKIPYNGLKLQTTTFWDEQKCSNELPWQNLKNHFNLKYLEGFCSWDTRAYCHDHHPFATLIRNYGEKLGILRIDTPHLLVRLMEDNPQLNLPHLKVLNIAGTCTSGEFREADKEAVEKLLNAAPNLDQIVVVELDQLKLIPEEKLPSLLLDWPLGLNFRMEKNDQIDLLHVISQRSPCVKQLSIYVPPFRGQFEVEEDYQEGLQRQLGFLGNAFALMVQANLNRRRDEHGEDGDPEDEIVDPELRRSFDQACQRMLHNSHTNLETLSVYGVMPLMELDFPPLQKVTKFEVTKRYVRELEPFWNSIGTIDYDRIMPGLQEVKICIHTGFFGVEPIYEDVERDEDWEADWPPVGNAVNNYYSSSTVNKLTLELQIRKVNLAPIQAIFPNVSKLHFHVPWTGGAGLNNVPLAQVWKYFPQLTELEITGDCRYIGPSLDADFCGITEEEAEMLGQQTDEYLKLVHVVPIRPSVLTMKNLRDLYIEYDEFGAHDVDELDRGDRHYFISKVARLVAFDRMRPEVEVHIPSYMEAGQDIEEESDLEEDEMMDYDDSEDDDVVVLN